MTDLLEIREKIKLFYSRFEPFIVPVLKFLLAFIALNTLNSRMGYMIQLNNIAVVLIVSLMCSFLPANFIVVFGALFSLLHMYALSAEVLLVGFCLYLVMFLLFFRFTPKDSLVVVLTPLLFALRVPYVVPVAVGLVCGPASIVSVACGVGIHYFLQTVIESSSTIRTMAEEDFAAKLRFMIDGILGNREMMVMAASFAITVLAVYLIRRMSVDHAWTIAMVSGALLNIVILLVGDLIYNINISVLGALLGSLLALVVAKIVEFFRFCVDYSRTEKVQFEDDEYYYYVKAVPKMSVAMSTRTVKKISGQSQYARGTSAPARAAGSGAYRRSTQPPRGEAGRRVTTENTAAGRGRYNNASGYGRRENYRGGKSVTIGSASMDSDQEKGSENFEEFF